MAGKRGAAFYDLDASGAKGSFAQNLYSRMVALGWNQSEMARQAEKYLPKPAKGQKQHHKIGRDLVSHYIRGVTLPRPAILTALAKALNCKEADLLPSRSVPSVSEPHSRSSFTLQDRGNDTMYLEVRRVMPTKKAMQIVALLNQAD